LVIIEKIIFLDLISLEEDFSTFCVSSREMKSPTSLAICLFFRIMWIKLASGISPSAIKIKSNLSLIYIKNNVIGKEIGNLFFSISNFSSISSFFFKNKNLGMTNCKLQLIKCKALILTTGNLRNQKYK